MTDTQTMLSTCGATADEIRRIAAQFRVQQGPKLKPGNVEWMRRTRLRRRSMGLTARGTPYRSAGAAMRYAGIVIERQPQRGAKIFTGLSRKADRRAYNRAYMRAFRARQ